MLDPWLERLGVEEMPLHIQMDKTWEPIHRCLTGDLGGAGELDFDAGDYPLKLCVLGGDQLLEEGYRTASVKRVIEVRDIATALAGISPEWFRERFFDSSQNSVPRNHRRNLRVGMGGLPKVTSVFLQGGGNRLRCHLYYLTLRTAAGWHCFWRVPCFGVTRRRSHSRPCHPGSIVKH